MSDTNKKNWEPRIGNFMKRGVKFNERPLTDDADKWRVDFDWNAIVDGKKVAGSVSISLEVIHAAIFDWRDQLAQECWAQALAAVNDH